MGSRKSSFLAALLILAVASSTTSYDIPFDYKYEVIWGHDHVSYADQGKEVQLWMDQNSGAGFASKLSYGSGFFHLRMKLPNKDSAGVVTAFYLSSDSDNHDELDFEFLGNKEGKPITLQTNVFANGKGNREQRILLWFDPTADFHTYKIMWNTYIIVFYIDSVPIRVFRNATFFGVDYPTKPMKIRASIWNGDDWATDGGQTKIDWAAAPFTAHFQGFGFDGCTENGPSCHDPNKYWWNGDKYQKLHKKQAQKLREVREKYMNYDYCSDRNRHPQIPLDCYFNVP